MAGTCRENACVETSRKDLWIGGMPRKTWVMGVEEDLCKLKAMEARAIYDLRCGS